MSQEKRRANRARWTGIAAALTSACFLGFTPVFGKQAINLGMPALAVVAIRTALAAFLVFLLVALTKRSFLYIYPAGLLGCLLAGGINGFGSLLYYGALARIPANLGQLLYALYPLFVLLWLWLDRQPPTRLTLLRLLVVLPGVFLLTFKLNTGEGPVDWVGIAMMLGASALYALHLPINQRVLYDMPAPTVTLYTLTAMALVVVPAYAISVFIFGAPNIFSSEAWGQGESLAQAFVPVAGLTFVTFFSRLTLFLGVKHLGGLQTALLGLGELLVTLVFAQLWLGESLTLLQWVGAGLIALSLSLIIVEKSPPQKRFGSGFLVWLRPPGSPGDMRWPLD